MRPFQAVKERFDRQIEAAANYRKRASKCERWDDSLTSTQSAEHNKEQAVLIGWVLGIDRHEVEALIEKAVKQ